jgi:hypothetical protein
MPTRPLGRIHPPSRPARIRAATVAAVAGAVAAFLGWYGNRHDFYDLRIYVSAMRWRASSTSPIPRSPPS